MEEKTINYRLDHYADPESQKRGCLSGGLYYYLIPESKVRVVGENHFIIPPTEAVINVAYYPYLNGDETVLVRPVCFDINRFKLPETLQVTKSSRSLYRIGDFPLDDVKLGTFKRYNIPTAAKQAKGLFDWRREGKLFQYPFTKLEINDHVSTPFEIKPHLFSNSTNSQAIHVKHAINNMGMYLLYAPGYKSDSSGLIEGSVSSGLNIPTTSSFYMDHMARNQASLSASRQNAVIGMASGVVTGAVSGGALGAKLGSAAGPWGIAAGAVLGAGAGLITGSSGYRSALAQEKDAENSPATLRSSGGDVLFNMQVADGNLYAYRLQYPEEVMERIGWFFHLYGYKQNRVLLPDVRNRYFYNYIKTENVNLSSSGIPKEHLLKLRMIYDNGVTIWHADRSGVKLGDFSNDNYEI